MRPGLPIDLTRAPLQVLNAVGPKKRRFRCFMTLLGTRLAKILLEIKHCHQNLYSKQQTPHQNLPRKNKTLIQHHGTAKKPLPISDPPPASTPDHNGIKGAPQPPTVTIPDLSVEAKRKNWELPLAMGQGFSTFIDHDTILDKQQYPLFPNRSTTYVLPVDGPTIKIFARNSPCPGAAGRCKGKVYWQDCRTTRCRVDIHKSGWGLLRHEGFHDHPWPTPKKPDPEALEEFFDEVKKNPKATALQLRVGTGTGSDNHKPISSVVDIHESLGNADRLRYYRRLALKEVEECASKKNGGSGGDSVYFRYDSMAQVAYTGLLHLFISTHTNYFPSVCRMGLEMISSGHGEGQEHYTFQTRWMSQMLLSRREEGNKLYSGGLISDVTYKFFKNGYLLTTSIYCDDINRWIPVQLSWILGLSESYYEIHFTVLFRQFLLPSISPASVKLWPLAFRTEALKKLKGCREHFCQSIIRVQGNRQVLRADQVDAFVDMAMALIELDLDGRTHEERIDEMRRIFPNIKRWLDWWTMADVAAILFPSCRKMLEDCPDGDDGLPSSTNAQESMHRVYYIAGKKTMLKGMIKLYAFVIALERDHSMVMKGMPIKYGGQLKKVVDVSESIGWKKPTKRQRAAVNEYTAKNDGRPPDTTAALLGESGRPPKRAKMGRPTNSLNINKNPYTTFVSYAASEADHLRFRCWLAAALGPYMLCIALWLKESDRKKTDLFNCVVTHFTNRTSHEITGSGTIKSILSSGSGSIFNAVHKLHPESFLPGKYASCDLFIETILDPHKHSCKVLSSLFWINVSRTFTCPRHKAPVKHALENSTKGVLRITKAMFDDNGVSRSNPKQLLSLWSTIGLHGVSAIQCPQCKANLKKTKSRKAKTFEEDGNVPPPSNNLTELSIISFPEANAPVHLFFHLELATLFADEVLRNVNGVLGVWIHDNQQNAGHARLVDTVAGSIGGAHQDTSWVIYSRVWTAEEDDFVVQSVARISKDNPKSTRIPFTSMRDLLNLPDHNLATIPEGDGGTCEVNLDSPLPENLNPEKMCNEDSAANDTPPLKIRIRRPPKLLINSPPRLTEAPLPQNHSLEEDVLPLDTGASQSPPEAAPHKTVEPPVAKATLGRPKKVEESLTTFKFKPAMDVVDPDAERLQARREANWHVHLPSNLIELAPKAESKALPKASTTKKALAPKKALATKKAPASKEAPAIEKAPATNKAPAPKKRLATKKAPAPKEAPAIKKAPAPKNQSLGKKASDSVSSIPSTSQAAAKTPFQPAPLTDADWERIAACGDAYWGSVRKEKTAAEIRQSSQHCSSPVQIQLPPTPFHPRSLSVPRAVGNRRSSRISRA
ncbi:hypothetical protein PSTT_11511 [Puccinia striiformis]|uniref:GCM domain-containing protein n=1 Tax=Puccinia striiformis TaxID=27350 RepID=A0A2S4V023_9BASI|nr:hypothetical protein PSTT_11511 [Puccinia striiformis]